MAEQNVPAQSPTKTDEQIVPRSQWLMEKQPSFQRTEDSKEPHLSDISRHPEQYQLLPSIHSLSKCSCYLPVIVLENDALAITPVIPAHPFELPPSGDTVIDFVNELGYPEPVEIGIVTQTNIDHAKLIWEEFIQGIHTFFSHKASHKASLRNPKKKVTPLLILYGRFSKVIIYYLASNNNIHRHPNSAVHHTEDDYVLGNLKKQLPNCIK
ncbi:hypothetical protein Tco_1555896 [Tanacetum coccineum]